MCWQLLSFAEFPGFDRRLKELIAQYNLEDTVELKGSFCMGHCADRGVCVKFQDEIYSLTMDTVDDFFAQNVAGK